MKKITLAHAAWLGAVVSVGCMPTWGWPNTFAMAFVAVLWVLARR